MMNYRNMLKGIETEKKFERIMIEKGNTLVRSNAQQDIHDHIDYFVNDYSVDVKSNKDENSIWLELVNVTGKKGWLYGKADYIAFDMKHLGCFCFFKTFDLLQVVKDVKEVAKNGTEFFKLYTRKTKKDKIVRVKYTDIEHLEKKKVCYG